MRILFLTTHLNTGGITTYLMTLTKGLISRGCSVHIASSGGNMETTFTAKGARLINLNIRTKSELSPRLYLAMPHLKRYIKEQNIEIIHAQTRITQVMGRWLNSLSRVPYVSTCHGYFKPRLSRRIFPCWGDAMIAISPAVYEHLEHDFGVKREKIALISSGVDIDEFPMMDEGIKTVNRRRFGLGDEPLIGIVARLSDVKGQDILIKAMKIVIEKIPRAKLFIAGEGKWEAELKDLVRSLGLTHHVIFHPRVNQTAEILSMLDVFVMPSRSEGLGLSVMEAQACGLPVVTSRVGGIPSLIEDGKTGFLVEPENPGALAEALVKVLESPNLARRVGSAARKFVEEHCSSDKMVDKTLALYKGITQKRNE